ncbi:MAG TPA: 16S rRNA (adenine(1518)-N(6)/adenine(1519)-N(6))-dimethyltransferase RsmA [Alphaproteobacteria bacterium]|nr:16S rRNA (adenine(1518)-N(6)/adenine(1519)-N(6))-dimethyltransferase RsmA [Alphaproteobacteria bacterium]
MTGRLPDGLPPLKAVIAEYGLAARRALGQHFLLDPAITARIAAAAGDLDDRTVIEIGPGPGGLTRALLAAGAASVVAIERDDRCVAALEDLSVRAAGRLIVVAADAIAANEVALARSAGRTSPLTVVANLPYNIATVLILKWLAHPSDYTEIVVMVQKEVAARLAAPPSSAHYGRLSVMVQWRAEVATLFDLAPGAFTPPPKVVSTVVRITPRPIPLCPANATAMEKVVRAAFGQRRKMLRSALNVLGRNSGDLLSAAGIAPTKRAEELSVEDFCRLARAYASET